MFSRVFSGWYCWKILICLLLDTILHLLRLISKLVSPTALQALACFLVHILADFATFSSGGAKTEKLYNDLNFDSLKKAFFGVEWTEKISVFFTKDLFYIKKTAQNYPTMNISAKNSFRVFFREFVLCCINCIKIILFSHQNKLLDISSNFYHRRRRWQWRHGTQGMKPRPATQLAAPDLGAVLINPKCNQELKMSTCSINMYQKKFQKLSFSEI